MSVLTYAKAFASAAITGFGTYVAFAKAGSVTLDDWYVIVVATATSLGVVYKVPNKDKNTDPQTVDQQPFVPDLVTADGVDTTDPNA